MAFNFPASVAACLAAAGGFKVPRQLAMYCIAQDTGTPYMLYKDGMERGTMQVHGQGGNGQVGLVGGQWGPGPPHQPSENGYVTQSTPGSNPGPGPGPGPGTGPGPGPGGPGSPTDSLVQHSTNDAESTAPVQQPPEQHPSITPPVPSPYADQSQPQQSQQQPPHPPQVNGEDDTSVTVNSQPPQVTTNSPPLQESTVERQCFSTQTDMSQSYYVRGTHMLSPGSFMSYLKQPGGVMLTQLNSSESGSEFASGMPDLLSAQQGKLVKQGSDLRLFKCLTCGKDFKQKSTLLQHERIHTDSRPYGCSECGKRFRQQSHLTQHLRIHANEKPFACVYCERTFRQRAILNQHLRIHSGEKPFSCSECGKRFRQKAILNQHVRTHQDVSPHLVYKNGQLWPQDVPFPADKDPVYDNGDGCFSPESTTQFPAYFKDSKGMTHGVFGQGKVLPDIIQHGRSAGMPLYVRCPICQKEFKQKSTLLQHGCIHIESRPYPCGECGKRFRQQSHLTQHLRIHTNEKPYACIYCGRNFRQRTILNQHLRIHTGEKPYKCPQCGKDFRQKAILDQHTRTHQGDRPYCCPMPNCRRRFSTEQEVKRHIDNHMNPHASKRRTEIKHRVPSPPTGMAAGATAIVKPELYFPQCYAPSPAFTHHQYTTASAGVQDFKSPPPTTVVQ